MKTTPFFLAALALAAPAMATSWGPFSVFFEPGDTSLSKFARPILDNAAATYHAHDFGPDGVYVVGGHSDRAERSGAALSCRRASRVYDYLRSKGVPDERLIVVGFGDGQPLIDAGGEAENRRAEVNFMVRGQVAEHIAGAHSC